MKILILFCYLKEPIEFPLKFSLVLGVIGFHWFSGIRMLFETRNSKAECKALPIEVLFECSVILKTFGTSMRYFIRKFKRIVVNILSF